MFGRQRKGRVTGIGGVFFKAKDAKGLQAWYQEQLGITPRADGTVAFEWREKHQPEREGYTVWGPFPQDTQYFDPSEAPFMVNFRVDDLDALLAILRDAGVEVDEKIEEYEFGRFGWAMDPEGNRIELWEPPEPKPEGARTGRYVGTDVRLASRVPPEGG